ncbi:MAG: tripartite tricarboxylate transporter TctB family protein [Planctomycetes bacterium]|nr:tripartite tricarboxylate transporter TctB family protein [Planctomycetota bacterium]
MKKIATIISVAFMALAIGIFCIARTYPGQSNGAPGPGFFPMILSVIVFLLAAILLVSLRKERGDPVQVFTKKNATVFLTLVITVAYVVLIRLVGFPPATVLFLLGLMVFFQVKSWKVLVGVPVLATWILYSVFTQFLSVQFPKGMLF